MTPRPLRSQRIPEEFSGGSGEPQAPRLERWLQRLAPRRLQQPLLLEFEALQRELALLSEQLALQIEPAFGGFVRQQGTAPQRLLALQLMLFELLVFELLLKLQ